jgi:CheY-like chemotaxis protein
METYSDNGSHLKILLVEDNPGDVFIIKDSVKSTGTKFAVSHSSLLRDAIQILAEQTFDVILLDLGLPDSIGIQTLNKILASNVKAPVIVMTGLDDEETALAALKEGAQDYLVKNNLTSENILRAIRYGIERKKIQEIQVRHARQFLILSSATIAINECENIASIYNTICQNINSLLSEVIIFPLDIINQITSDLPCNKWFEPFINQLPKSNELTTDQVILDLNDCLKEVLHIQNDGKLHEVNRKISNLFNNQSKLSLFEEFEITFSNFKVYAIDFTRDKKNYGGIFIFSKNTIELNDIDIIEAICSQASLNIHRRNVENDLKTEIKRRIRF